MSEYQYYEWQTIDRALTAAEQAAVNKLSSHIDVTSTRAWVEYHWGDFKHDPRQVLKELSAPLAEFVSFFQLDPFLVQAAAEASEPRRPAPRWPGAMSRR